MFCLGWCGRGSTKMHLMQKNCLHLPWKGNKYEVEFGQTNSCPYD